MVSPIENGARLPIRKNLLVKGAMVVGGVATAVSGLGVLKTQRAEAQGPTPTPIVSESIQPVEPTPAPNQVLLKNPNTGECVLVVFPNQALNPDNQVVTAIAEPTSVPTPTPELIAQAPGADAAPLLQPEDDPTNWEPCQEGEEPTATMTAEPTISPTEPTQTPTATFSPEEIQQLVEKYSLEEFLKKNDPPLKIRGYQKVIKNSVATMSEFMRAHGQGMYTLEFLTEEEKGFLDTIKGGWSMDWAGFRIANAVTGDIINAQKAASEGNVNAAQTFTNVAEARVRLGKTMIDFRHSPDELDKEIVRITESGVWGN